MSSQTSAQAFCLKLNSHQAHVIDSFQKLYSDELMVDCTLSCNGGSIKAHKLVLSACSPYFTSLFSTFTNPYQYPVIILKDMPFQDLKAIIEFMYKGEVTVPQSLLPSVLESAKSLMITGLREIKIANVETSKNPELSGKVGKRNKKRKHKSIDQEDSNLESEQSEIELTDSETTINQEKLSTQDAITETTNEEINTTGECSTFIAESIAEQESIEVEHELTQDVSISSKPETSKIRVLTSNPTTPTQSSSQSPGKVSSNQFKQNLRQLRIEKTQATTGNLSGRKMWSEEETKSLVRIWEEESARVWASAGKKVLSLKRISDMLIQENVDRDVSQVEGKIKALKRDYKAVKYDKAIPAVQQRMAPYLEKLEAIFSREEL